MTKNISVDLQKLRPALLSLDLTCGTCCCRTHDLREKWPSSTFQPPCTVFDQLSLYVIVVRLSTVRNDLSVSMIVNKRSKILLTRDQKWIKHH